MKRIAMAVGACAMTLAMAAPGWAQSAPSGPPPPEQENHELHHPEGSPAPPAATPQAPPAGMQQKMMDEMKVMHGRLDALVARLNAATGDAKVAAMAELLTAMVGQHAMMCEGMMKMPGGMMMPMKDMK